MEGYEKWLWRPLPDEFFDKAGRWEENEEEVIKLLKEIPKEWRGLANIIITLTLENQKCEKVDNCGCLRFRCLLYKTYKDLLDNEGIDLKLPYYWYADGPMILPEVIVRVTNGLVGFACDDSYKGCLMKGICRYYPKEL